MRRAGNTRVVFLVGFMGAGKTTVGRALAERLAWSFEDLDERIQSREGQTIEQICRAAGESALRIVEHETIRELLGERESSHRVVALGGGAIAQPENAAVLRDSGFPIVFLDAPVEVLWQRCREQAIERPLSRDMEQFRNLYQSRRAYYATAGLHVDTNNKDIQQVAAEVVCSLGLE